MIYLQKPTAHLMPSISIIKIIFKKIKKPSCWQLSFHSPIQNKTFAQYKWPEYFTA